MTSASPGPHLFSILNTESYVLIRSRKDTFLLSFVGQAALLAIIIYLTSRVVSPPEIRKGVSDLAKLPLVFLRVQWRRWRQSRSPACVEWQLAR